MIVNVALFLEYEMVCSRPEHLHVAGMDAKQLVVFLDAAAALAEPVESHFVWRPQLRDPADEMVLEAAVNGGADALVTFNRRDYGNVPEQFGVRVMLPREAIRSLAK